MVKASPALSDELVGVHNNIGERLMTPYIERLLDHMITEKYIYLEILERKLSYNSSRMEHKKLTWKITEEYGKIKQLREHIKQTMLINEVRAND